MTFDREKNLHSATKNISGPQFFKRNVVPPLEKSPLGGTHIARNSCSVSFYLHLKKKNLLSEFLKNLLSSMSVK